MGRPPIHGKMSRLKRRMVRLPWALAHHEPPLLLFADREWLAGRKLLVHCNQGGSRALSLALLFLAKCRAALSNDSYLEARSEYEKLYPGYKPGPGIQAYLRSKWHKLGAALRQGGGLEPVRR